jgi:hypothetical protein
MRAIGGDAVEEVMPPLVVPNKREEKSSFTGGECKKKVQYYVHTQESIKRWCE